MQIDEIIAEIEQDFSQYKTSGLIDRVSMYRWAVTALKKFGQSICTLTDKVIEIKNGKGVLPNTFHSLDFAISCKPRGYHMKSESPGILSSLMWKEKVERKSEWNSCEPCCTTESETIVTENIYFDTESVDFYYEFATPLRLGKSFVKTKCTSDCRNKFIKDSPYEITINGEIMYTNFNSGYVYIQYYGIEEDEKGLPIVPDTPKGELATYVEYYLKKRLIEKLISNGDDVNLANLLSYYAQQENTQHSLAMADAKFMTLTPDSYRKLADRNRKDMLKIKRLLPRL